jgi:hypothetical protein
VDVVIGATDNSACTRDHQWNLSYTYAFPQMVVCAMQY